MTNPIDIQNLMEELILNNMDPDFDEAPALIEDVKTFEELGRLTNDNGLVITTGNGKVFTITITEG